jgi:hypothetical protein
MKMRFIRQYTLFCAISFTRLTAQTPPYLDSTLSVSQRVDDLLRGGEGSAQHPDGMWLKGNPFVGDPPKEPQGRNSIFNADNSTLLIVGEYAKKMQQLNISNSLYMERK